MRKNDIKVLKLLLTLLGISLIFLNACKEWRQDSVCGSSLVIEETRNVASFHSIDILGSCDLYFVKAAVQELRLVGEHNILPLISTWARGDGTLIIENKKDYRSNTRVKVYVSMLEIQGFSIYGAGIVEGEHPFHSEELNLAIGGSGHMKMDATTQRINTSIYGSGDFFLGGRTNLHDVKIFGSGNVNALDLITSKTEIRLAGSGNCYVYVKDVLDVVLFGSGNIYYKGNPGVINSCISGSGQLIKLE
jgi:hypothetical protein